MTQQKILIDVTLLFASSFNKRKLTGIERVIRAYIEYFHARAGAAITIGNYILVFSDKISQKVFKRLLLGRCALSPSILFGISKNFIIPKPDLTNHYLFKIDNLSLSYDSYYRTLKQRGVSLIVMIHDLIPIDYPEYCHFYLNKVQFKRCPKIITYANGILTNSKATYTQLVGYAAKKKLSLPPIESALLGSCQIKHTDLNLNPINRPYFIIIGTIEGRKNHLLLLQIWRILVAKHGANTPKLIIIGQRGWKNRNVIDMLKLCDIIRDYVTELTATDFELTNYLKYAQALLFPSFSEGFGLPLVEALSLGVPVIASDLEVFKEIAGNVPEYIHPIDGAAWLSMIEEYSNENCLLRKAQIERMKNLQLPTWEQHFEIVENFMAFLKRT